MPVRPTVVLVLLVIAMLGGCTPLTLTLGPATDRQLRETVVRDDGHWSGPRVAIVDVSGFLVNAEEPALFGAGDNPTSLFVEQLQRAGADDTVRAIILRLNTPGGTVTASDVMYRELIAFKQRTGKPVVALTMDVAASGGYYLACGADEILAYPTSVTGSIGVIMQLVSVKPALERIGVETEALVSGPNKDAGSPFSRLTPEQRAILSRLVDDFHSRFVAVVRDRRPAIPADRFDEAIDGRVFSGAQAVEWGIVDRTGDLDLAFERAKQRAGLTSADLVRYHRPSSYIGSAYAVAPPTGGTQINLAQINLGRGIAGTQAGFLYLWDPAQLPAAR